MSLSIGILGRLVAIAVLVGGGCVPVRQATLTPAPSAALPDTQAQQALVRTYIALVAAERFPDAWQLLAPERQRNEPPDAFAADWRAWGHLSCMLHANGNTTARWPATWLWRWAPSTVSSSTATTRSSSIVQ